MTDTQALNASYAIVFPGQGSQSLNMLGSWSEHKQILDDTLEEAHKALGYDLR